MNKIRHNVGFSAILLPYSLLEGPVHVTLRKRLTGL